MPSPTIQRFATFLHKPWFKRTLFGLGALLLVFGLFGYFALPGIVKSQVEKLATEKLHRQLNIEKIEFSPYALALTIRGAKLLEPDGKKVFVAFDQLYVNVSAQSLFRLAPVVEEARLDKPYVHLVRTADNHYNIDDIIQLIASQPPSPSAEPARFAAYNLQIAGGRIEFEDEPVKAKHLVSELNLGVPFVSSLPSQLKIFVEPLFSAKIDDALLKLKGKASPFAEPKEASLALDLDDVDLTQYVEYLPFEPRFKLPGAKLDVHLSAVFRQAQKQGPILVLKGTAALKSLAVTELDGKPMIKLPQLAVTLDDLNVFSSRLDIARVLLDHPEVEVVKRADGSLNLTNLAPPEQKNQAAPKPEKNSATKSASGSGTSSGGRQFTLGELAIQGAHISYSDEQALRPLHGGAEKFDLSVKKTSVDLQQRTINIGSVTSSSAEFALLNGKPVAGKAPVPKTESQNAPIKADNASTASAAPGYIFNVEAIGIDNWSMRSEDRSLPQTAVTTSNAIRLGAQNISNAAGKRGHVELSAGVNKQGQLAIAGDIGLAPLHTDLALDLKSVDLMPLQPYITDKINLLVTRAAFSTKASLKLDEAADGKLKGGFNGDLAIVDLATVDKVTSNDFLRWKSLSFGGVNAQLSPLAVNIDQIALTDFFARVIVDASGRINLQDIASSPGESKSLTTNDVQASSSPSPSTVAANKTEATQPTTPTALPPVKIRKVKMQGGRVRFSDNFIKPNYTAELKDLGGTVSNLSSDAASSADVDLQGNVNSAPLIIAGSVNPLKKNLFLNIKASVKEMELAPLNAYSGKYIGYGIEKGKLSFEVAYHLEDRKLEAQNRLILDQLTLGDKIDSPTATTLPVKLALTLLSDSNGVIDINLPIGGSLDDPQFSVGGIIIKVIVNLIAKAATSPFALLGSMFGGGEELSWLAFDPGYSTLQADSETKLNTLAKALNDRPALKLDITGHYDAATDLDGMRRARINHKIRSLKLKQLVSKGESADINTVTIKADEYPTLLAKVYKNEDFSKPRNLLGLQKDLPVEEMEKLMMQNIKVSDSDLLTLGNQRAQAAKDWLVKNGAVPAERIFILAAKPADDSSKATANRVDFSLH